jgi:Short C-terminal domain/Phospholipase_D-nuclease N-terminal
MIASFGVGEVLLSMFWFFLFFIWIMLLFKVFGDIFRDRESSGMKKFLWTVFVIIAPYLGVFIYLIVNGHHMAERDMQAVQAQDAAMKQYVREAAGTSTSTADELARLADLRDKGVIDEAEFQALKAKAIS